MPGDATPGGGGKPGGGYGRCEFGDIIPGGGGIGFESGPRSGVGPIEPGEGAVRANCALSDALGGGCEPPVKLFMLPKPPGAVIGGAGGGGGATMGMLPDGRCEGAGAADGIRTDGGGELAPTAGMRTDGGTGGGALTRLTLGGLWLGLVLVLVLVLGAGRLGLGVVLVLGSRCDGRSCSPGRVAGSSLFLSKRCVASSSSSQSISRPPPLAGAVPAASGPPFAALSCAYAYGAGRVLAGGGVGFAGGAATGGSDPRAGGASLVGWRTAGIDEDDELRVESGAVGMLLCEVGRPDGGGDEPGIGPGVGPALPGIMPGGACMPMSVFLPRSRAAGVIGLGGWGGCDGEGGPSCLVTGAATGVRIDEFGGAGGAVEARCCGTLFFPSPSKMSRSDPPLFSADILYVSCRLISPF